MLRRTEGAAAGKEFEPSGTEQRTFVFCDGTLHSLFGTRRYSDVVFLCDDGQRIEAHKFVLACRSQYFKQKLYARGDNIDENVRVKTYGLSAPSNILELVLEYLYTGVIAECENNLVVEDDSQVRLWVCLLKFEKAIWDSLVNRARSQGASINPERDAEAFLGGFETYVRLLLVRCRVTNHHIAACFLSMALEQSWQEVVDAMMQVMLQLPFDADCLSHFPEEALAHVLQAVPFKVDETTICRAVAQWKNANLMDDDEVPEAIQQSISCSFISMDDFVDVVEPLQLFGASAIDKIWESYGLSSAPVKTTVNTQRGSTFKWNSLVTLPLSDEIAYNKLADLQLFTTLSGRAGCASVADDLQAAASGLVRISHLGSERIT